MLAPASAAAGQRRAAQAHTGGVEDGVGERRGNRADRALAGTRRRQFGAVNRHDVDRFRHLGDVEDRVGEPVGAGDLGAVEGDLLRERPAGALDNISFDAAPEPVRVDDQPGPLILAFS
jgi:hypothetical protein